MGAHTSGSRVSRCLTRALGGACESGPPPPICRLSRGVAVVSRGVESRATRAEMHERGGGAAVVRKREGHARRVRAKQAAAAGRPDAHAAPSALVDRLSLDFAPPAPSFCGCRKMQSVARGKGSDAARRSGRYVALTDTHTTQPRVLFFAQCTIQATSRWSHVQSVTCQTREVSCRSKTGDSEERRE